MAFLTKLTTPIRAHRTLLLTIAGVSLALAAACSAGNSSELGGGSSSSSSNGSGGDGGLTMSTGGGGSGFVGDPQTCEEAAASRSYIGCDFWPTVTPNAVWSIFDYAVVVANTGSNVVDVTVTRGGQPAGGAQIQPDSLQTIYLPWVQELKGPDADPMGVPSPLTGSALVANGAYNLTTTFPVTVYQFNALEYAPQGGPPGKNWNLCPADGIFTQCFSYSNDASLLLPSTAMTGNYRITGTMGWPSASIGSYVTLTGTADGTTVNIGLSPTAQILAGGGIQAAGPGGSTNLNLNRGEVALLLGPANGDLSGSLISASAPIQVLTGISCTQMPEGVQACDHVEESVFPAETLGQHYIVTMPTGPNGDTPGHWVRMYGNFDNTALSYLGAAPPNAPTVLNAGDVVDLGVVQMDFEVQADQAFAVATWQLSAELADPNAMIEFQKGDPAQSFATAVEQYRDKYVFLAPTDYDVNYVDIIQPAGASVSIDGQGTNVSAQPVGTSGYGIARVSLSPTTGGVHLLQASAPVGIQVSGYGSYTSYYYPGGLNLKTIAPPPVK